MLGGSERLDVRPDDTVLDGRDDASGHLFVRRFEHLFISYEVLPVVSLTHDRRPSSKTLGRLLHYTSSSSRSQFWL
jgi:hypothetical protein